MLTRTRLLFSGLMLSTQAPGWREEVAALQVEYQQLLYSLALGPHHSYMLGLRVMASLLESVMIFSCHRLP